MGDEAAAAAGPAPARVRGRNFVITVNNPTPAERVLWPDGLPANIVALVYQIERGAEGTEHVQAFIAFKNAVTPASVKKLTFANAEGLLVTPFARAHIEIARDVAASVAYCKKEDTRIAGPWELGIPPSNAGKRSDLASAAQALIDSSGDLSAVDPATFVKYNRGLLALVQLRVPAPRRDNLKVITLVGPTAIGKSYSIHDLYPGVVKCQWGNSGAWFPGYTGQDVVAFEEFRGQIPLQRLLQYLDIYPIHVEQKGGSYPLRATLIFITSNSRPEEWYKNDPQHPRDEELAALYRRLDYIPASDTSGRVSGIRYVYAESRAGLHQGLNNALSFADLQPKPPHLLGLAAAAPAAAAPAAAAAAADEDEEPPRAPAPQPGPDPMDIQQTIVISDDSSDEDGRPRGRRLKRAAGRFFACK